MKFRPRLAMPRDLFYAYGVVRYKPHWVYCALMACFGSCRLENPAYEIDALAPHEETTTLELQGVFSSSLSMSSLESGDITESEQSAQSESATGDGIASSSHSTGQGTIGTQEPWPADGLAPTATKHEEHCARGAKTCFLFDRIDNGKVFSQAPTKAPYHLVVDGATLSSEDGEVSPGARGLEFSGEAKLVSDAAHPLYKNQDFGIDLLVTASNRNSDYPAVLMELGGRMRLTMASKHELKCVMDPQGKAKELTRTVSYSSGWGKKVEIACFMYQGKLHLWTSDSSDWAPASEPTQVISDAGEIILLGQGTGPRTGQHFSGSMYMLRFWNNIHWMRSAILAESPALGLGENSFPALSELEP